MSKLTKPSLAKPAPNAIEWRSRTWQALPFTLLGTTLFAWVSSAQLNFYASAYIVLLAAQLGAVGLYIIMSRARKHRQQR